MAIGKPAAVLGPQVPVWIDAAQVRVRGRRRACAGSVIERCLLAIERVGLLQITSVGSEIADAYCGLVREFVLQRYVPLLDAVVLPIASIPNLLLLRCLERY